MARLACPAAGFLLLAFLWAGPLTGHAGHAFAAHMTLHMGVVAVAAPLIAIGIAGSRFDPTPRHPVLLGPLLASFVELVVVWGWHVPALHELARGGGPAFAAEQATFFASGLLVWTACLGHAARDREGRSLQGTIGLLVTSIHMTLLGALLSFAGRSLYDHGGHGADPATVLADQQAGGIIMLLVGGASYLTGGLVLMARILRLPETTTGDAR
ncbi:cytochrome c oxidase assembly protein [Methylobrevis pamukkalensis]|uniref:Cytochrome c oxidase caa3 assembly factor n=1 Tax=Methylobrevis pamukkalensis TaxID=1439726 RepID=A0A1E3H6K2_9HYPH|nr:cytochrome c oxidase assembly protein [Methylobrevis pamukkalensis]ODN71416.1 Cytochrome c oxidase caa3 assembly factor [Methylobrevis pamukkalensis]